MPAIRKAICRTAGVLVTALTLASCSDGGVDVELNAPILDAVGVNLMGKPTPTPNLPDRPPLVLPPQNAALPAPGQAPQQVVAANGQQWPTDPEEQKKLKAAQAKAEYEKYCREGNWKAANQNMDDFRKNVGQETRCRPEWIKNALSGGDKKDKN
jgi:hypothetical protein